MSSRTPGWNHCSRPFVQAKLLRTLRWGIVEKGQSVISSFFIFVFLDKARNSEQNGTKRSSLVFINIILIYCSRSLNCVNF
jgi:hypothetical protein